MWYQKQYLKNFKKGKMVKLFSFLSLRQDGFWYRYYKVDYCMIYKSTCLLKMEKNIYIFDMKVFFFWYFLFSVKVFCFFLGKLIDILFCVKKYFNELKATNMKNSTLLSISWDILVLKICWFYFLPLRTFRTFRT